MAKRGRRPKKKPWDPFARDRFYQKIRDSRKCSCGRPGIGLDKYGSPVCSFHNSFPTEKVKDFPPMPEYKEEE